MAKCLNCGKEVAQTPGKRAKIYCNDKCRMAFYRKAHIVTDRNHIVTGNRNTERGITPKSVTPDVIPEQVRPRISGMLTKERQVSKHGFNK